MIQILFNFFDINRIDIVDLGLNYTNSELMVKHNADGGIIITSHNPTQWNALKLLNEMVVFKFMKEN